MVSESLPLLSHTVFTVTSGTVYFVVLVIVQTAAIIGDTFPSVSSLSPAFINGKLIRDTASIFLILPPPNVCRIFHAFTAVDKIEADYTLYSQLHRHFPMAAYTRSSSSSRIEPALSGEQFIGGYIDTSFCGRPRTRGEARSLGDSICHCRPSRCYCLCGNGK